MVTGILDYVRYAVWILSLLSLFAINNYSIAQGVTATASVDSHNIFIGDWLKLNVEVRHPADVTIQFPAIPDSLQGFEVINRDSVTRKNVDGSTVETTSFTLTTFDSGTYVIPPMVFQYAQVDGQKVGTAETSPIAIFVHGVGVDTTKDIKDIKPPVSLPISFAELLPYILSVLGAGGAGWLVYYILKKRRKGESILPEPPPRPAHELALEALRSLEAEKLWQRGLSKEYHSKLTDIIRTYVERRFHVMAMEMITDEILSSPAIAGLEKDVRGKLQDMLLLADLVKFAKFQPMPVEHERSMQSASGFIETTGHVISQPAKQVVAQEAAA